MPPIYTPKQVKELLSLPGSTLRRYAKVYADYLSQEANQARRNYTEQEIGTLARIRDLSQLRRSVDEIKEQLQLVVDDGGDDGQEDITALALPGILEQVNEYKADLEREIAARQSLQVEFDQLQDRLDAIEERERQAEERKFTNRIRRIFVQDEE